MDQRREFVLAHLRGDRTMAELCRSFGVSRKTGYKWVNRFFESGLPGLADLSRAPVRRPHALDEAAAEAIVALRKEHPTWGPKKLLAYLSTKDPEVQWPAQSTVGALLKRRGLVKPRRRRPRTPRSSQPLAAATEPNVVWCTDYKGKFRVGRHYCNPLTISDAHSRFLLECKRTDGERFEPVQRAFEHAFHEYGLPLRIRSDNGSPFASKAVGGLSRLSVWWIKLGILPERIEPGHPEQNGRHERMHRTLKLETASPPLSTFEAQQEAFDRFRECYNHERPHEALGQITPGSLYRPSSRPMPKTIGDPEYPPEFEVRRVKQNGTIVLKTNALMTSSVLRGEAVGVEEIGEDRWQLWFGPVYLGLVYHKDRTGKPIVVKNFPVGRKENSTRGSGPTHVGV
ncbi:MAG: IS481 family transposase [Myxococcota bacterium]